MTSKKNANLANEAEAADTPKSEWVKVFILAQIGEAARVRYLGTDGHLHRTIVPVVSLETLQPETRVQQADLDLSYSMQEEQDIAPHLSIDGTALVDEIQRTLRKGGQFTYAEIVADLPRARAAFNAALQPLFNAFVQSLISGGSL